MSELPALVREALRVKKEVEIETASSGGESHRVVIWVVVVDGVPYVRSVRGAKGRWFRELTRTGEGAVHVGARRIAVRATRVTDADENARVSRAIEAKYDRPRASVIAMVRDEVLATTVRLGPA